MLLRSKPRPKKASRVVLLHLESLESRNLMSAGVATPTPGTGLTGGSSTDGSSDFYPIAIMQPIAPPPSSNGSNGGFIGTFGSSSPVGSNPNGGGGFSPALSGPYVPSQIRTAYGVNLLDPSYTGKGQTIAIVDAYNDTSIASDLAAFDSFFNIPAPPSFTQVHPQGTSGGENSGWDGETALDVEWAHAMAPQAKILLVEANVASGADLDGAVKYAEAQPGVYQVSMSYGGGESPNEIQEYSIYNKPGITFFASAGDSGTFAGNPASAAFVTSVGGTSLFTSDNTGTYASESAWNGSGGGYSAYVTRPAYQNGFVTNAKRGIPDVSLIADPNTGVYVYSQGGFFAVGGTSVSSPIWAGFMSLANQGRLANGLPTVGTGKAFGTNTELYNLAGGTSYTNPNGDFRDITTGNNGLAAKQGWDPVTGLGTPVINKLIPDLVGATLPVSNGAVIDSGFESNQVGSGSSGYGYDPGGSGWTFTGTAGVSGNGSAFTSGNPAAPQGAQVAFIQRTGSFTQSITGITAGIYQINFADAQRGNYQSTSENFEVMVDNNIVGTYAPLSTSYRGEATTTFNLTAGTHSITFLGLNTVGTGGGDNTALIDNVSLGQITGTVPTVGDTSFETVSVGINNYFVAPSGSAWGFTGTSGIAANGSVYTQNNPVAPAGSQVAYVEQQGSFTQTINGWAPGTYEVTFSIAQRGNAQTSQQNIQVLEDGQVIGTFNPQGTTYENDVTTAFTYAAAGNHTITFQGLNSNGGDNTVLIDKIGVTAIKVAPGSGGVTSAPAPLVSDATFGQVSTTGYTMDPTGSAWAYTGTAGISTNGSAYTNNNPNSPQGTQVGFIEQQGSFTQTLANWAAGNYLITFNAARRIYAGQTANEDFALLIDGVAVSTFSPSTSSYNTYWSAPFAVSAGSHSITFVGLNSTGGDNTAFINGVKIVNG